MTETGRVNVSGNENEEAREASSKKQTYLYHASVAESMTAEGKFKHSDTT